MAIKVKDGNIEADSRGTKGWVTKYKKKAEFWEAEARRLGSTAEYKMHSRQSKDTEAEEGPEVSVQTSMSWEERFPVSAAYIRSHYPNAHVSAEDLAAAYSLASSDPEGRNVPQPRSEHRLFRVEHGDPVGQGCIVNGQNGTIVRALRNKPGAVHPYMAFKVFLEDGTTVTESANKVYRHG